MQFDVLVLESWSLGFRVCGLDLGFAFGVSSLRFQDRDFKFVFLGLGFGVWRLGLNISSL